MTFRWQQWEPRQQVIALSVAGLAAVLVCGALLWNLHGNEQQARSALTRAQLELDEAKTLSSRLQMQQHSVSGNLDLLASLNQSLQQAGLQATRMQQDAPDEVQLRFESIPFDGAIAWLAQVEQQGDMQLSRVTLNKGPQGAASLSLTVRKR